MSGHALRDGVPLDEQIGGPTMEQGTLDGRHVLVDGGADDGVRERQRIALREQVGADQRRRGRSRARHVELGELRREPDVGSVTDDRGGANERARIVREQGEPHQDRARDCAWAELLDPASVRGDGLDPVGDDAGGELPEEQRIPADRGIARGAELVVGVLAERRTSRDAAASADSSEGRRTSVRSVPVTSAMSASSTPGSAGRRPATTTTGRPSILRTR